MTMEAAALALNVPFAKANDNCVQDAQWRLREVLALAGRTRGPHELAPDYVQERVRNLKSWL